MTKTRLVAMVVAAGLTLLTQAATGAAQEPPDGEAAAASVEIRWMPNPNRCLEIPGSSTATGTDAQLWPCENQAGSRWQFRQVGNSNGTPLYWIYNPGSDKCLSLEGVEIGRPGNGFDVQLEPCEWEGADNGRGDDSVWWLSDRDDGPYRELIRSYLKQSNNEYPCMEIEDEEFDPRPEVQVWDCVGQDTAQWHRVAW